MIRRTREPRRDLKKAKKKKPPRCIIHSCQRSKRQQFGDISRQKKKKQEKKLLLPLAQEESRAFSSAVITWRIKGRNAELIIHDGKEILLFFQEKRADSMRLLFLFRESRESDVRRGKRKVVRDDSRCCTASTSETSRSSAKRTTVTMNLPVTLRFIWLASSVCFFALVFMRQVSRRWHRFTQ